MKCPHCGSNSGYYATINCTKHYNSKGEEINHSFDNVEIEVVRCSNCKGRVSLKRIKNEK